MIMSNPTPIDPTIKQKAQDKMARNPVKFIPVSIEEKLPKPKWIRIKAPISPAVDRLKTLLRQHNLFTVCEEATCPNLTECFSKGTATFMIMGDKCTRRCAFCDVGHGRPDPLDVHEPENLATALKAMSLKY